MASCCGLVAQPHQTLLKDCYPPSSALLQAGPEYKPLSSDLSKLTYRCTNQARTLVKVGEELEKRVGKEVGRSTGGNQKYRASLLISLAVLRALISECRRDLSVFARSIMRIVDISLDVKVHQKGEPDLEVIGRAASCFIAYATYIDGGPVNVDDGVGSIYLSVLKRFSALATSRGLVGVGGGEKVDLETQNRTRLIALAALNGASSSDALFSSNSEFKRQVEVIIPALLTSIFEGSIAHLRLEAAKIEMDASPSPFFTEFSARRPVNDRRAPSLHAHIPGEKGPAEEDVLSAALRSLHGLIRQCQVNQASLVLDAVFTFVDRSSWQDVDRCCWLAERLAAFVSLQYRFVIPTRLVERLADLNDGPMRSKHATVLAMITTILTSSTSLVGLGVTDLLNNLVALIVRRIRVDSTDGLLPSLVQSISSLGTHVYYADQINDIIEEIVIRMSEIETSDKARPEVLRVLTYCIIGVMITAQAADATEARLTAHQEAIANREKGKGPQIDTPAGVPKGSSGRWNPVTPQVWQETLPLLCESTYAVRAAYARALVIYLVHELPREAKARNLGDLITLRFCNALHAAIYTLAMSACLGVGIEGRQDSPDGSTLVGQGDQKLSESPTGFGSILPTEGREHKDKEQVGGTTSPSKPSEKGVSFSITGPTPTSSSTSTGNVTPPKKPVRISRRVSLPLNRLNSARTLTSFENVATPFDFAAIMRIWLELHAAVPNAALMTGVPMLLALDRDAGVELVRRPGDGRAGAWVAERKRCVREVVGIMWRALGEKWGVDGIVDLANTALNSLAEPFEVPSSVPTPEGILPAPEDPTQFNPHIVQGESSNATHPLLDSEGIVGPLSRSVLVQRELGKDQSQLIRRWAVKWTVETALKDSVERFSSAQIRPPDDTHYKVANMLMSLNNSSYQSFGRPAGKTVDVTDLREALGGRGDPLPTSSPPSIISTARSFGAEDTPPRKRVGGGNTDVQEVLKDIFESTGKGSRKHRARKLNGESMGGVMEPPKLDGKSGEPKIKDESGVPGGKEAGRKIPDVLARNVG